MDPIDLVSVTDASHLAGVIAASPQVHSRLLGNPTAHLLVVLCGDGTDLLKLATAYPRLHIDGLDPDDGAIAAARRETARLGLDGRVRFEVCDQAKLHTTAGYTLVAVLGRDRRGQPLTVLLDGAAQA